MVYMAGEMQGPTRKLCRPFHGPYRIISLTSNNAEVTLIDKPKDPSIFVALNQVCLCYDKMLDASWTGPRRKRVPKQTVQAMPKYPNENETVQRQGPVTRSMTHHL